MALYLVQLADVCHIEYDKLINRVLVLDQIYDGDDDDNDDDDVDVDDDDDDIYKGRASPMSSWPTSFKASRRSPVPPIWFT